MHVCVVCMFVVYLYTYVLNSLMASLSHLHGQTLNTSRIPLMEMGLLSREDTSLRLSVCGRAPSAHVIHGSPPHSVRTARSAPWLTEVGSHVTLLRECISRSLRLGH